MYISYWLRLLCISICRWVPEDRLKRGCSHSQPMYLSTPTHDQSFNDLDISNLSLSDDSFSEQSVRGLWQ